MKFLMEKKPGANGNAYSSSKRLYESIKVTKANIIESSYVLNEAVDFEFGKNELGGVIVFSTDVNATELSSNKLINAVKKKIKTISNRVSATKKIDTIANKHDLVGWTVGKFLSGRYKAKNGTNFGENSLSVEIVGVPEDELIHIAEELCEAFNQETVLVKCYESGRIVLVNADKGE